MRFIQSNQQTLNFIAKMSKWNKTPSSISEEFLQNEERRRQMILEAAKRRKQKQKKLQEQAEIQKRNQEEALLKHKKQKKDAYVKYLRSNMHDKYEEAKRLQKLNMPEVTTKAKWKKDQLQSNNPVNQQSQLEGLDLNVNIPNSNKSTNHQFFHKVGGQVVRNGEYKIYQREPASTFSGKIQSKQQQKERNQSCKRRMLQDQFESLWKEEHDEKKKQIQYDLSMESTIFEDMIGSKMLDSLDLDFNTISRGKQLDKKIKQSQKNQEKPHQNHEIDQIKNIIGYESVLVSIDQRTKMMNKYNQFMKNEVQTLQTAKQESQQNKASNKKITKNQKSQKQQQFQKNSKPQNQGEVFDELKNKKEGKILNWAKEEAEKADDLFSNCSTNQKSKTKGFQILKQINKQIQEKNRKSTISNQISNVSQKQINMKKKEKALETIPEKKINKSLERLRQRSVDKKTFKNDTPSPNLELENAGRSNEVRRSTSKEKPQSARKMQEDRLNTAQIGANHPPQPPRNFEKQKVSKTAMNSFNKSSSQISVNLNSQKSYSKEKESQPAKILPPPTQANSKNQPLKIEQPQSSILGWQAQAYGPKKMTHLSQPYQRPTSNMDEVTVATQDQIFEIESFIKNQLLCLNKEEKQLQQELKNIHISNKDRIKQVEKKYDVKTDYKHSHQLRLKQDGISSQRKEKNKNFYQHTQKRQNEEELEESIQRLNDMLLRKEIISKQKARITEEDQQSEASHQSIINPMSDPISLHKQVLQLAENLSRFEGEPQDLAIGYGAKLRMKKKSVEKEKENKTQLVKKGEIKKQDQYAKKQTQVELSESQDINYSGLNSLEAKSKVSRPPELQYSQKSNCIPGYDGLDLQMNNDQCQDSIEAGKIKVNEKLRKMLLE